MRLTPAKPTPTTPSAKSSTKFTSTSRPASKATKNRHLHFRCWLILWLIIYILILITGFFWPKSTLTTIIKLSGVLLCSVYSIQTFPHDYLLQLAMMTTFIADCLLACDNISIIGLMIFFVAQIIHLYRMTDHQNRPKVFALAVTGLFVIACANLTELVPSIYVIVVFYVIALVSNLIASLHWHQEAPQNLYAKAALAGFLLFACCDLCIIVSYMALIQVFPSFFYVPTNFFAWFFYYPSQILVSNSSKRATIDTKEGKC